MRKLDEIVKELKTSFKDFKPDELVGKYVLNEYGDTHSTSHKISQISRVTKTSFKISSDEGLYDLFRGQRRGMGGRMDMGRVDECYLLTDEEAIEISKVWKEAKRKRALLKEINERLSDIEKVDVEDLQRIYDMLNKSENDLVELERVIPNRV